MKQHIFLLAAMAALGAVSSDRDQSIGAESAQANPAMSFLSAALGARRSTWAGCGERIRFARTWRTQSVSATRPGAPT
jgi:hypothetical protein